LRGYSRRTHRVLTACSRRSKWSLKEGVLGGTRRSATHGAAVLGRTNGSRCSGCRRTSTPSVVRVAPSTHVALKCPPLLRTMY
jgi:hypothetical protein